MSAPDPKQTSANVAPPEGTRVVKGASTVDLQTHMAERKVPHPCSPGDGPRLEKMTDAAVLPFVAAAELAAPQRSSINNQGN